jgi:hypothetical protein
MATIKKNKILAKKSKTIGKYKSGGSPTDPPVGGSTPTDPPKAAMTAEEKAEAKAEAAAAAKKAEEARIAGLSNKQFRQEKRAVKRNVALENERAGKNEGKVAKAVTAGISAGSGILGLAEGIKKIFKREQKTGGIIKTKNMTTKTSYKTGGMVNANAKLVATKSAGSKGVKAGVNPKAAASNVAKKPSKPRSKAPKKAAPGRK